MNHFFESERLVFRSWTQEDKDEFRKLNADQEVMKYFPDVLSHEESDLVFDRIRKNMAEKGYGLWAVEIKESGDFIGFIGFNNADFRAFFTPCIEIAWRLKSEAWGKGFATEGAKRCLRFGFENLGLSEVCSFTSVENTRSEKVMKRIGMIKIAEFDHPEVPEDSTLRKHILYRINKSIFFRPDPESLQIKIIIPLNVLLLIMDRTEIIMS